MVQLSHAQLGRGRSLRVRCSESIQNRYCVGNYKHALPACWLASQDFYLAQEDNVLHRRVDARGGIQY